MVRMESYMDHIGSYIDQVGSYMVHLGSHTSISISFFVKSDVFMITSNFLLLLMTTRARHTPTTEL